MSLILWRPRGILDESMVNEIIAFIEAVEKRNREPLNRFADLPALDAVDLNFDFALLRLAGVSRPRLGARQPYGRTSRTNYVNTRANLAPNEAFLRSEAPVSIRERKRPRQPSQ
jgi:hypothetical protein